jgi:hypothetical protein
VTGFSYIIAPYKYNIQVEMDAIGK